MLYHFPVEILKDKIKNLFECVLSKEEHQKNIEFGLSRALKLNQSDMMIAQSAEINEGVQEGTNKYLYTIKIHSNYMQFLWLLTYYNISFREISSLVINSTLFCDEFNQQNIIMLRESFRVYTEAINMLIGDKDKFMQARRGLLFRLPNPLNNTNIYTDYTDSIIIYACVFMLHHEYGHFVLEHDDYTPTNKLQADEFSISKIVEWIKDQENPQKNFNSFVLGISMDLICSAYVSPGLKIFGYPDIDIRLKECLNMCEKYSEMTIPSNVYEVIRFAVFNWMKQYKINFDSKEFYINNPRITLCNLLEKLHKYKEENNN